MHGMGHQSLMSSSFGGQMGPQDLRFEGGLLRVPVANSSSLVRNSIGRVPSPCRLGSAVRLHNRYTWPLDKAASLLCSVRLVLPL